MLDDISALLATLAARRPVFHSEADFQHALAWEWQHLDPQAAIRLEYRIPIEDRRAYADLWIRDAAGTTCVELKYWTQQLMVEVEGERFSLVDQGAQPLSRYDFLKDLERVERIVRQGIATRGYVIALTNVPSYWNPGRASVVDTGFRLDEGRLVSGTLVWASTAAAGTTRGREQSLHITGAYTCQWRDYSQFDGRGGILRYLLVSVDSILGG